MLKIHFETLRCDQKFARDDGGALVDKLIERVLSVRAGFPPHYRARTASKWCSVLGDAFAITLHIQLLEIGRQTAEALVIGQYRASGVAANVVMPNANQRQQNGHVFT